MRTRKPSIGSRYTYVKLKDQTYPAKGYQKGLIKERKKHRQRQILLMKSIKTFSFTRGVGQMMCGSKPRPPLRTETGTWQQKETGSTSAWAAMMANYNNNCLRNMQTNRGTTLEFGFFSSYKLKILWKYILQKIYLTR